ncbi:MAG: M50 family metallopeptidase [Chloroflexota bacterium]|nr:M50 family metallopeptidase [Chloroflexota bacterium]
MFTHLTFFRQRALIMALLAAAIVFILWNIPLLSGVLYPFRLFVTFVHESGHGIAALISGGEFGQMVLSSDGSGHALTSGGIRALILPAGYLGAALFGAVLFYLTNTVPFPRTIAIVLGGLVGIVTLLYTQPLTLAFFVGLGMALALVALWRFADRGITMLALNVLAIITGLNALFDLITLTRIADLGGGIGRNDAAAFSAQVAPVLPASGWALVWAALSVVILAGAIYLAFLRRRVRP